MRRRDEMSFSDLPGRYHEAWQDLRADYAMGTNSRFRPAIRGVQPGGSGADYHYRNERNYFGMIERSRFFDRENMVVGAGINQLTANVIQEGMTLDPDTGDEKIDADLKAAFWDWAEDPEQCDVEGELNFAAMEAMLFRGDVVDGDTIALPLRNESLQFCEAHRLRTPNTRPVNCVHGVVCEGPKSGRPGRRVGYWITREEVDLNKPMVGINDAQYYAARDAAGNKQVLHVMLRKERFSQRRGVPAMARATDAAGMHDDIQFAALVKQQIANCWAILEELASDAPALPNSTTPGGPVTGSRSSETLDDGTIRTLQGMGPGMIIPGRPGRKYQGFAPNVPSPQFFEHATLILSIIAVNLGIPLQMLLLDPTKTNFSGWRGALDEARKKFRIWQRRLIEQFHSPVYRWKVRQFIAKNPAMAVVARRSDIDIFGHKWNPPRWRYIEPNKDAAADDLRGTRLITSRRRIAAERGEDWDEIRAELIADNASLIDDAHKRATELCKAAGSPPPVLEITWRDILAPLPPAMSVRLGEAKDEPADAGDDETGKEPAKKE